PTPPPPGRPPLAGRNSVAPCPPGEPKPTARTPASRRKWPPAVLPPRPLRPAAVRSRPGQNPRPILRHGDRVFEVGRIGPIPGHRLPPVLQYLRLRPPRVHHRFHGQHHSRLQPRILVLAIHVVRDLRLFMELGTDAMAHVLPHHRKTIRLDVALNGPAHVEQPVSGPHLVDGELERF